MKRLYSLYAVYSTGFNLVWKVLPAFLAAFFGAFEISLIFASYLGARVFIIPAGLFSDRMGKIKTIRLSFSAMILLILCFLLLFGIESFPGWIIFALITGIIVNLIELSANTIAASVKKKTQALFGVESMYQLGVVLGPIFGGLIALRLGIETALVTYAVLNIIGILLTSGISVDIQEKKREAGNLWEAIKKKKFAFLMVLVVGSFFTGFIQSMQELVLPLFAENLGFDLFQIGLIIGLGSVITIAGLLLIGKRIDTESPYKMLLVFFIFMLIFPVFAPLLNDMISLIIIGGVFLIGRTANLNISRSFFSEFSDRYKATVIGVGETVYYFSRSFGSVITGLSIESMGYSGTFNVMIIFTVIALLGSLVLIIHAKRR